MTTESFKEQNLNCRFCLRVHITQRLDLIQPRRVAWLGPLSISHCMNMTHVLLKVVPYHVLPLGILQLGLWRIASNVNRFVKNPITEKRLGSKKKTALSVFFQPASRYLKIL